MTCPQSEKLIAEQKQNPNFVFFEVLCDKINTFQASGTR